MDLRSWCGRCGESFRLAELIDGGYSGRCPRCGLDLSPGYGPVASSAVHDLMVAADALLDAAGRLHEVAPRLHLELADVARALGEVEQR